MRNNKKILNFYKDYFKDLNIATLRSENFILMLEFDIMARFNFRPTRNDLKRIIESIKD